MPTRARRTLAYAIALVAFLTALSSLWAMKVSMPDNVYISYGLPAPWLRHQLVTIAGAVDRWLIDQQALATDVALWIVVSAVTVAALDWLRGRSSRRRADAAREG